MDLDSKQLMKFLAVIDHGSLGRAAMALNLTQPALTRSIKEIEGRLGVQLFQRHSTGMTLTQYGHMLERQARVVQSQLARAYDDIRTLKNAEQTIIRVGAVSSASVALLPPVLAKILDARNDIAFVVSESLEDDLTEKLLTEDIDVAVAFDLPDRNDIELVAKGFSHLGGTIIAQINHAFRTRSSVSLGELRDSTWVLPPLGTRVRQEVIDLFESNGLDPPTPCVETRSILLMQTLVSESNFLSWFPHMLLISKEAAGRLQPLTVAEIEDPKRRSFSIYRKKRKLVSKATTQFISELENHLLSRNPRKNILTFQEDRD